MTGSGRETLGGSSPGNFPIIFRKVFMPDDNSFADLMQGDMKVRLSEVHVDGDAQL